MRSIVENPKTSNSSQVVPAPALETVERPPSGRVEELPRHHLPLCIQTIGLQWRYPQGGWSWDHQDSGDDRKNGSQRAWFKIARKVLCRCGCRDGTWPTEAEKERLRPDFDEMRSRQNI